MDTTEATEMFLNDLAGLLFDADQLPRSRRVQQLSQVLEHVRARACDQLTDADPAGVTLTDRQWARIEASVSKSLGSARAER